MVKSGISLQRRKQLSTRSNERVGAHDARFPRHPQQLQLHLHYRHVAACRALITVALPRYKRLFITKRKRRYIRTYVPLQSNMLKQAAAQGEAQPSRGSRRSATAQHSTDERTLHKTAPSSPPLTNPLLCSGNTSHQNGPNYNHSRTPLRLPDPTRRAPHSTAPSSPQGGIWGMKKGLGNVS